MAGGFAVASEGGQFESRITPIVVISCIMAATGGLMFGYDVGVSGGVTSMPHFLKKFFPVVYLEDATTQPRQQLLQIMRPCALNLSAPNPSHSFWKSLLSIFHSYNFLVRWCHSRHCTFPYLVLHQNRYYRGEQVPESLPHPRTASSLRMSFPSEGSPCSQGVHVITN
ncbi:hypothetical protein MLD38_036179 [Melastoma candidum]|uniref:Uncharacterized protein n=1 Tax=Melastoma candidum TaxID=119954 RepID=A0ACB9LJU0_9MYRT|nr:hypothetical protein MLD38_036179 [Melastoma candidum]